jgi:Head domain of trimeric autotransporter adhesin
VRVTFINNISCNTFKSFIMSEQGTIRAKYIDISNSGEITFGDNIHIGTDSGTNMLTLSGTSKTTAMGQAVENIPSLTTPWVSRDTTSLNYYFTSIAYSSKGTNANNANTYIAIAPTLSGTGNDQMIASIDGGTTWMNEDTGFGTFNYWIKIVWIDVLPGFMAVSSGPSTNNRLMYKPFNGSWTSQSIGTTAGCWSSITACQAGSIYNNVLYTAVRADSATQTASSIGNHTTWGVASYPAGVSGYFNDILSVPEIGYFCAVGGGGAIVTYTQSQNWVQRRYGTTPLIPSSASASGVTATVVFGSAPALLPGQTIWVQGFGIPQYNGVFQVLTVVGNNITYTVPVSGLGVPTVGVIFGSTSPTSPATTVLSTQNITIASFELPVNDTTGFPTNGTLSVVTTASSPQTVTYTGIAGSPIRFTGCVAGGTFTTNAGSAVTLRVNVNVSSHNWVSIAWSPSLRLLAVVSATGTDTTHQIATSPDGVSWKLRSTPVNNPWSNICWSSEANMFIAIAPSGTNRIMQSSDGIVWKASASVVQNEWRAITSGHTSSLVFPYLPKIVAVSSTGTNNRVMTSNVSLTSSIVPTTYTSNSMALGVGPEAKESNSLALSSGASARFSFEWNMLRNESGSVYTTNNNYRAIAWSPSLSLFVAIADAGDANMGVHYRVATSLDGRFWNSAATTPTNFISGTGIAWSPLLNIFVAVQTALNSALSTYMSSPDGVTWSINGFSGAPTTPHNNIMWCNELTMFVACGVNTISTSRNGFFWTDRTVPAQTWNNVAWSPELGIFAAIAITGTQTQRVITSPDGITWTAQTIPNVTSDWYDICWSSELRMFAACATSNTSLNAIMISYDGKTWYMQSTSGNGSAFSKIIWISDAGIFLAIGSAGNNKIIYSRDGINWLDSYFPISTLRGFSLTYAPELKRVVTWAGLGFGFSYADVVNINTFASSQRSIAIGAGAQASDDGSIAIGTNVIANKPNGLFINHRVVGPEQIRPCGWIPGTNELVEWIPYYCDLVPANGGNMPNNADLAFAIVSDPYNMSVTGAPPLNFGGARGIRIPVSGIYSVMCKYQLNPNTNWTNWGLTMMVNQADSGVSHTTILVNAGAIYNQINTIATVQYFNTGDLITMRSSNDNIAIFMTFTTNGSFRVARLR